ncbi:NUDIX hydrolase [Embleya sp. AB8]|uniref:NUDIX hydrolase n=1 Tax=Embleya sp. AB8 TaxID=3156304 RepID=UPI003C737998
MTSEAADTAVEDALHERAITLLAIAQTGLAYVRDVFDLERYEQVRATALALLELISDADRVRLREVVTAETGHATPKLDARGVVFDARERVLLIRERSDGCWTLPGGWCDVPETPSEAVCREVREESGLHVDAVKLIALLDRRRQGHLPHYPYHVYKMFFLCREVADRARHLPDPAETLDTDWFALDALPELSTARITEAQLHMAHRHLLDPTLPTEFD